MKSTFLRAALVLCAALGLASCGGKAAFDIQGVIATDATHKLIYPGLVLSSNGMDLPVPANVTTFKFPKTISYGEVFNVTIKTQPQHETCQVFNPTDTAGRTAVINVAVSCSVNQFAIGGSITGLTADGLMLTNGSNGVDSPLKTDTSFKFPTPVNYGDSYGVTVLTQPAGQTCSVTQNASGVMGDADVTNIAVVCVTN